MLRLRRPRDRARLLSMIRSSGGGAGVSKAGNLTMNLAQPNYYSDVHPFINALKTGAGYGNAPVDANGYPTGNDSGGNCNTLLSMETKRTGVPNTWLLLHNGTGNIFLDAQGGVNPTTTSGAGTQRVAFIWNETTIINARINFLSMTVWPTQIAIIRTDHEALYNAGEIFHPDYVTFVSKFSVLRFMDWGSTNGNPETSWVTRTKTTDVTYANPTKGVPPEIMAALCVKAGVDMWYNVPFHYTQASWQAAFAALKTALGTRRLHVEYSNEVWNGGFEQHGAAEAAGAASTPAISGGTWYGKQCVSVMSDAIAAFSGQRSRLTTHLGIQQVYTQPYLDAETGFRSLGYEVSQLVDEVSGTFYTDGGFQGDAAAGTTTTQKTTILNLATAWAGGGAGAVTALNTFFNQMRNGGTSGFADSGTTLTTFKADVDTWAALALSRGWDFGFYEGQAYHLAISNNWTQPQIDALLPFFQAAIDDARTGTIITDILQYARSKVRGTFAIFMDIGLLTKYGDFGTQPNIYLPDTVRLAAYKAFQLAPGVTSPAYSALGLSYTPPSSAIGGTASGGPVFTGGKPPRSVSIVNPAALPPGKTFNGFSFTGTYTTAGTYNYTIRGTDALGATIDLAVTETVLAAAPTYTTFWIKLLSCQDSVGSGYTPIWGEQEIQFLDSTGTAIAYTGATALSSGAAPYDNPGTGPEKAIDGDTGTKYENTAGFQGSFASQNIWWGVQFPAGKRPATLRVTPDAQQNHMRQFTMRASSTPADAGSTSAGVLIIDNSTADVVANISGVQNYAIVYPGGA